MYKVSTEILRVGHRVRPGGHYTKTSITIHSTGNAGSTAENERAWLDNQSNDRAAAWHFCVGNKKVIQAIPEDEEAWHCGKPEGNKHSIAIEIIESGDRTQVLNTAAEFTADLLKKYGWELKSSRGIMTGLVKTVREYLLTKAILRVGLTGAGF